MNKTDNWNTKNAQEAVADKLDNIEPTLSVEWMKRIEIQVGGRPWTSLRTDEERDSRW